LLIQFVQAMLRRKSPAVGRVGKLLRLLPRRAGQALDRRQRDHQLAPVGIERVEAEVAVEARGVRVDRADGEPANPDALASPQDSLKRVGQQCRADAVALVATVDGEPREQGRRDREVRRGAGLQRGRRVVLVDLAGDDRVVANDGIAVVYGEIGARRVAALALACVLDEPTIKRRLPQSKPRTS
jgi:hypothetical protein